MKDKKAYKFIFPSIAIIVLIIGILVTQQKKNQDKKEILPQPKDVAFSEGHEEGEWIDKLNWIEGMHKCDSNVNWRAINYHNKYNQYLVNLQNKSKSNVISIADGELTGEWRETGSNNLAGRTHLVEIDQTVDSIYCASSGGNIWKADKEGNGWYVLNDDFQIDDIRMLRKVNDRLLVASGGWGVPGFYYSDDDGHTWTAATGLSNIADWGYVIKSVVLNNTQNTIYLLAMEWDYGDWEKTTSIYVSTDMGESFSKELSYLESSHGPEGGFDIWCDPQDTVCYLAKTNEIYSINNYDYSAELISQYSQETTGSILLSGCKTDTETHLYTAVYADNHVDFYYSDDNGENWTQKGSIESDPFMKNSFCVSQLNPTVLYYGGVECYRSSNSGNNWTRLNEWGEYYSDIENKLHADIPGINSFVDSENNEFVYINSDGGTYISYDQLQNVQNISMNNLNVGQFYSVYSHKTNSSIIFGGSQDQGYQYCDSDDGETTSNFTQILSGDYGHIVSNNGGNSIWMVYPGYAMYYPDATTYPDYSEWWEFNISGQFWIPPLMPHPSNPNVCYLGGGTTGSGTHIIELTSNSGNLFANELSYDFSGSSAATAISALNYSPLNTNYMYLMNGNGEFFRSTDAGLNWEITSGFDGPDGNYLYGAAVQPSKNTLGTVYVAGSGYSNPPVFVSTDNGDSFSSMSSGLPSTMVYEIAVTENDEYIFAATDAGPYVFISENNEWYELGQGISPNQKYWTVDYNPLTKTAHFGTYGRGIWSFKILGTQNIETNDLSAELKVFPNTATTTITVDGTDEKIEIYTTKGDLVLESESREIDISNLSDGVYIVKTGNKTTKFIKD